MKLRRTPLALPASSTSPPAFRAPAASEDVLFPGGDFPPLTERLVLPEITRDEVVRGRKVKASPALAAQGDAHCRVDYVITAHLGPDYVASTDMLTRFSEDSDFATDTSVRRTGTDPATGERYLEELAFEVVNGQRLTGVKGISTKAPEMVSRGVRRVFAIFVRRGVVAEWRDQDWVRFGPEDHITDPTFARPVPIRALLSAAEADNAVARALIDKKNAVILQVEEAGRRDGHEAGWRGGRQEGLQEGELLTLRDGVIAVLEARGLTVSDTLRAQIEAVTDPWVLRQILVRAAVATHDGELFSPEH